MAKKKEKYLDGNSIQGADVWFLSAAVIWNVIRKSKITLDLNQRLKLNSDSTLEPAVRLLTIPHVPGWSDGPSGVTGEPWQSVHQYLQLPSFLKARSFHQTLKPALPSYLVLVRLTNSG